MDHSWFNGKTTAFIQDQFIIRCIVLACINHFSGFHGIFCFLDIPSILLSSWKTNAVNTVNCAEKIHGRGCYQIDVVQRLLNNCDIFFKPLWSLFSLWNYKKLSFLIDSNQSIAIIVIVYAEFFCVGKFHTVVIGKSRDIHRSFCIVFICCVCCTDSAYTDNK